jgi:hypothetical protein
MRNSYLDKALIMDRIEKASRATLEIVTDEIVKRAKAAAPVRKPYKAGGVRARTKAAGPALLAATIRSIKNNRALNEYQRKRYIEDIQSHPGAYRTVVNRRDSTNRGQRKNPLLLGGYRAKPGRSVAFYKAQPTGSGVYFASARGRRVRPITVLRNPNAWRASESFYKQPHVGFEVEPGSDLDQRLTSRARHAIKVGEGLTNEEGNPLPSSTAHSTQAREVRYGGRLKNSIKADESSTGRGMSMRVGTSVPYAKYVEFPTRHNAAQPFLLPAMRGASKYLESAMLGQAESVGLKARS